MSKSNTTALIIDKNRAEDEIFYDLERAELDLNDKHEHLKSFFISGKSLQTLKRTAEKLTDKLLSDKNKNIKYCTFKPLYFLQFSHFKATSQVLPSKLPLSKSSMSK